MSTTKDLIGAHARDLRRRALAPKTVVSRVAVVARFARWLGDTPILAATTEDVETWLDTRRLVPKSRYDCLSHLHCFYDWARRAGYGDGDPTLDIVRPKLPKRLPRPIADDDLAVAVQMAPALERAILLLAALAGLRCIEISRLTREDVLDDNHPPVLIAFGKGNKERAIPLHPEILSGLRCLPMPKTGPVFRSADGRTMSAWTVSTTGNRYLDSLGIDATLHQLRHHFGTNLYRTSGRDLLLVADLMGHASTTTSAIYVQYDQAAAVPAVLALSARPVRSDTSRGPALDGPAA